MPVTAQAGDTLQTLSASYHVPVWTIAQVNHLSEGAAIKPGQRIVIPRHLVPAPQPAVPVTSVGPNGR
jgi:LysM repeat protein